ncbi:MULTISPECIES: hypothetical protein [Streptomyces violaceusniger group]|uniref:Uncharacterized protein n=1 Tax=Streptomyces rhizosphaericus TaxID=114699 RepID=A0ABN1SPM2_9ACTN|nr:MULTISPECIES: hypothetical protein [Streptomyces violaceusniger group]
MAKVRADEAGHCGVERRLMAFGARPRDPGEPGRAWLEEALRASVLCHLEGGIVTRTSIEPKADKINRMPWVPDGGTHKPSAMEPKASLPAQRGLTISGPDR